MSAEAQAPQEQALWRQARAQLAEYDQRWSELQVVLQTETANLQALQAETAKLRAGREGVEKRAAEVGAEAQRGSARLEQLRAQLLREGDESRTLADCLAMLKSRLAALQIENCNSKSQFERRMNEMRAQLDSFKRHVGKCGSHSQP